MKKIIIAIDGYSSCGKSTTARIVANTLNYTYIDSGAMYRAVTLYFDQNFVSITNPKEVNKALSQIKIDFKVNPHTQQTDTFLNGVNVEEEIRGMNISSKVSPVSALAEVRKAMVDIQQKMGKKKGVVMDGRDIGTTVFPDAEVKIFMTADIHIRAYRRQIELLAKGDMIKMEEIIENLKSRDKIDTSRKESPLTQAHDAVYLDTSLLTIDEEVEFVLSKAMKVIFDEEENYQQLSV